MEFELKKLYDAVSSIHDEMFYLRERYNIMNSSANKSVDITTSFSYYIMLVNVIF